MAPTGPPADPPSRPSGPRRRQIEDWGFDEHDAPPRTRREAEQTDHAQADRRPPSEPNHDRPAAERPGDKPTGARPAGPHADTIRRRRIGAVAVAGVVLLLLVGGIALARGGSSDQASGDATAKDPQLLSGQLSAASAAVTDQARRAAAVSRFAGLGLPVYCGSGKKPWVALTFDDGPGVLSSKFITLLTQEKVPATMFRVGRNIPGHEEPLRIQRNLGWDSGSHTMNHPFLAQLDAAAQRKEIEGANRASQRALGRPPELFRPPYESHNDTTDRIVKDLGMVQVLWNVDTQDSLGATSAAKIAETAIKGLKPGSIILMHETKPNTLEALPKIIAEMRRRNLTPVTISEMLAGDPPSEAQLRKGFDGCAIDLTPGTASS